LQARLEPTPRTGLYRTPFSSLPIKYKTGVEVTNTLSYYGTEIGQDSNLIFSFKFIFKNTQFLWQAFQECSKKLENAKNANI
jgi:hypothetical protein